MEYNDVLGELGSGLQGIADSYNEITKISLAPELTSAINIYNEEMKVNYRPVVW